MSSFSYKLCFHISLCFAPDDEKSNRIIDNEIRTVFQNKQGRKTIDVYWISDDGGKILLINVGYNAKCNNGSLKNCKM